MSIGTATLIVMAAAVDSRSQDFTGPHADPALQRMADDLQGCLESGPMSTRLESTAAVAGSLVDTTRVIRWGTAKDSRCNVDRCDAPDGLQRVVDFEFEASEPHASWSADDRARLEELIPALLARLPGTTKLRRSDPRSASRTPETLRIRLDYRGLSPLQRDLDAWILLPRQLLVTISLVDTRHGGHMLAERVVNVGQGLRMRGRSAATAGDAWYAQLSATIGSASREVLGSIACQTPWLDVAMDQGKMRLSTRGLSGLEGGRAVLLIPPLESGAPARWPIAKIRSASSLDSMELELVRGSAASCATGCKAVLL
jgi:hypothetical protein